MAVRVGRRGLPGKAVAAVMGADGTNVGEQLRRDYMQRCKDAAPMRREIDLSPRAELLPRKLAHACMQEFNASFGQVHEEAVPELSLREVAEFVFDNLTDKFGIEQHVIYDPKGKVETREIRLSDPDHIGAFCMDR